MKSIFALFIFMTPAICFGQSEIVWSSGYELTLADFQSSETEISKDMDGYSLFSGANIDFSFQMSNVEFMMTKNFNSKVRTLFHRDQASIVAPDSLSALQMVAVAQYHFDLAELYSRKIRKELYEEKGAFSNASFFQPIFDKYEKERSAQSARIFKSTEFGKKEEILREEHQKVLAEIETLPDFCFDCKPPKKKKKKG